MPTGSRAFALSLLSAVAFADTSAQGQESAARLRAATFEAAWATVDQAFFDPRHLGVDWAAVGARYRDRLDEVDDDEALAEVLTSMLREIDASHLEILMADGAGPSAVDGPEAEIEPPLLEWAELPARPGTWIARVRSFDGLAPDRVDALMADIAESEGVILDLRGNEGGDVSFLDLASRFMDRETLVGGLVSRGWIEATRHPLDAPVRLDSLPAMGPPYELDRLLEILQSSGAIGFVAGGAPAYEGCVAVLVDRRTGSAAEAFAMAMDRATGAILVGEPTAGALLSSDTFPLPNGWRLRVPVAVGLDEAGRVFWDEPVIPDVTADPGGDAPVAAAVAAMESCASGPTVAP